MKPAVLLESLLDTPEEDRLRIAAAHGLTAEGASPPGAEQIAARLLEPAHLESTLAGLTAEQWAALKVVCFNGGDQGITVELCHQIVGLLSGRRRRSSTRVLDDLRALGLIYLRAQNYRQVFFVPTDLLAVLSPLLNAQILARLRLPAGAVRPSPPDRSLLEEVHRFLAYIYTHDVTLTQQGQIFKRHLRALLDLLIPGSAEDEPALGRYPEPLGTLVGYAMDRHLIARQDGRMRCTDHLAEWLEQPDGEKQLDLFAYWRERYYYQDLQTFLSVVRAVGGDWLSIDHLADELEPLINPSQRGSLLLRLRHHLATFLVPLGLFELGEAPGEGGEEARPACRLTPAGAAILDGIPPQAAEPNAGAPLVLQATFEVMAPRPVPSRVLWTLEVAADLVGQSDRMLTYRISRTSVHRALKAGLGGDSLLRFFEQHSATGVPQNVAFDLAGWSRAYGQLYLQEVMLLRCGDPLLAEQVKASRRTARFILGQLGPADLIVDPVRHRELLEALEADGLMPRPEVERS